MTKKLRWNILWLFLLLIASGWIIIQHHHSDIPYRTSQGLIFGTIYKITYQYNDSLDGDIKQELDKFDASLSMFNKNSVIAKINRNEPIEVDTLFERCFNRSMQISQMTGGDFDVTVCPLVNAWGFGFKSKHFPEEQEIQRLKRLVGYQKIKLNERHIIKSNLYMLLDFSAIAKGYGVDVVARLLDKKGIKNYMVDIGGEVVVKGKNPQNQQWRIGINKPIDDSQSLNQEIDRVLYLTDCAVATSGNYRNFYYHNGKKYSHEINPHTGYPAMNEILSATVITQDCMSADGFATAIMVMGLNKTKAFLTQHPEIDAYVIYRDVNNKNKIYYSKGMNKYFKK